MLDLAGQRGLVTGGAGFLASPFDDGLARTVRWYRHERGAGRSG